MDDKFEEGFNWWQNNSAASLSGSYTEKYIGDINDQVNLLVETLNGFKGDGTGIKQLKGDMAEFWHAGHSTLMLLLKEVITALKF